MRPMRNLMILPCLVLLSFQTFGAQRPDKMGCVTFAFSDGKTLNIPFANPPRRGDNLAIRAALIEVAKRYPDSRMLLAAMTEQWDEGGLACQVRVGRSGGRIYQCACVSGGFGCIRIIVEGAGPLDGPGPPPDGKLAPTHTPSVTKQ